MIAQLSQSEPHGSPASSTIGVRCAGSLARNSGSRVLPQTSTSSKSRPATRTKIRTVRLLTLGLSTLSVIAAISASSFRVGVLGAPIVRERVPRAEDERLDRVGEMRLGNVVVAASDPQPVRLEQHVCVGEAERRLEAVRGELDREPERILEVDRVHEAAVLHAAVLDPALVEPRHRLAEDGLRE